MMFKNVPETGGPSEMREMYTKEKENTPFIISAMRPSSGTGQPRSSVFNGVFPSDWPFQLASRNNFHR